MNHQELRTLSQMISLSEHIKFTAILLNTTDLEKLNDTYSIKMFITELKTNYQLYNILTVFTIIVCVDFATEALEMDPVTRAPRQSDLFQDYHQISTK